VCGGGSDNLLQNYYFPFIFLSLSTVCGGGSNYLLQNYYFPFIFLSLSTVCGGGSNYLPQNYYFPYIFLSLSTRVCVGGSNFACITTGRVLIVTGSWFQRKDLCPISEILCPIQYIHIKRTYKCTGEK
jgi:hypothetical protein